MKARGRTQGRNFRPSDGDFTRFLGRMTKSQGGVSLMDWIKTPQGEKSVQARIDRRIERQKIAEAEAEANRLREAGL